jgi:hypothetical protein
VTNLFDLFDLWLERARLAALQQLYRAAQVTNMRYILVGKGGMKDDEAGRQHNRNKKTGGMTGGSRRASRPTDDTWLANAQTTDTRKPAQECVAEEERGSKRSEWIKWTTNKVGECRQIRGWGWFLVWEVITF